MTLRNLLGDGSIKIIKLDESDIEVLNPVFLKKFWQEAKIYEKVWK